MMLSCSWLCVVAVLAGPVPVEFAARPPAEETLHYDGNVYGGLAVTGEYEYWAAIRFTPDRPCSVKAVIFYQYDQPSENGKVYIYGSNTRNRPGTTLASVSYSAAGAQRWKRVDLPRPVAVDSGVDFWTCVTVTYYTGEHPLGVDRGPLVSYRGGYIKVPMMGETWYQLSSPPFYANRNWNQRAIVTSYSGIEETLSDEHGTMSVGPTIVRGVLRLYAGHDPNGRHSGSCPKPALLLDATGRKVLDLHPGPNDVSRLAPGVYFVKEYPAFSTQHSELSAVRKVVRAE